MADAAVALAGAVVAVALAGAVVAVDHPVSDPGPRSPTRTLPRSGENRKWCFLHQKKWK